MHIIVVTTELRLGGFPRITNTQKVSLYDNLSNTTYYFNAFQYDDMVRYASADQIISAGGKLQVPPNTIVQNTACLFCSLAAE